MWVRDMRKDKRRKVKEIVNLHNRISLYRTSDPWDKLRDEYLRGWERALRWVLKQEDPPIEFWNEFTDYPHKVAVDSIKGIVTVVIENED